MAEYQYPEITFLRNDRDEPADARTPPSRRARSDRSTRKASPPTRKSSQPTPDNRGTDPDERLRHVTALVLFLFGLLMFLALISYTPLDQANADVRPGDVIGLFTNDPVVTAWADTTENWLGLIGALLANVLINAVLGYLTIVVPLLIGFWGYTVYSGRRYEEATRLTLFTLGVVTIVSAILGTAQLVAWMPHPAHEWTGSVGAFIATILSGLLGTAGSFLLLLVTLAITLIYATRSDLRSAILLVRKAYNSVRRYLFEVSGRVRSTLGETSRRPDADDTGDDRQVGSRTASCDNEPAQMVRRMRGSADTELPASPTRGAVPPETPPEPRVRRQGLLPNLSEVIPAQRTEPPQEERREVQIPPVFEQERPAPPKAEIVREPTTPSPTAEATAKLTLQVQDGETVDDLETGDSGEIVAPIRDEEIRYVPPSIDLLRQQSENEEIDDDELKENGRILQEKLATFDIRIENLTVTPGPVVTLYEFVPAAGIKIAQIESLTDDIALALKARGIRIIAPIPGKGTVGVEIPNHKPAMVRIRSVLNTAKFREAKMHLPLALGKTTVGEVFCDDLARMPHLLIAGATGSGKSVGINAILTSLLYRMHPRDLKFLIIDPKKIELAQYRALTDHFLARCPDIDEDIITNPQNAVLALKSLEMEMDTRYDILAKGRQRNIFDYNTKVAEGAYADVRDFEHHKLPYIVLILDELADLMITARGEVEEPIARLAQLARAVGIHLIVATQRPSVNVITGVIKANFPARIAYQVASKIDSRTILDGNGAEQLLGNGDMLYLPGGAPKPLRLQNAFVSTEEVELICEHIGQQEGFTEPYMLPSLVDKRQSSLSGVSSERDELFDEAARTVVRNQQGSVSLVQRRLKVGYSRAARIIDELETAGIVGPFDGSKARSVLVDNEEDLGIYL